MNNEIKSTCRIFEKTTFDLSLEVGSSENYTACSYKQIHCPSSNLCHYFNMLRKSDVVKCSPLPNFNVCPMPFKACDIATIPNPMNPNEILLFGGYKNSNVHIYDRITDKFTRNKHDFSLIIDADAQFGRAFVFPGMTKNTLIVTAVDLSSRSYYCIFNCQSFEWDEMDDKDRINVSNKYCHKSRGDWICNIDGVTSKYKNYLIASKYFQINISQINVGNQYIRPQNIARLTMNGFKDNICQVYYSCILIGCHNTDINGDSNYNNSDCNDVEMIFFCSKDTFFDKSFVKLYINLDEIEKLNQRTKSQLQINVDNIINESTLEINMTSIHQHIHSHDKRCIFIPSQNEDDNLIDINSKFFGSRGSNTSPKLVCSVEQHPPEWTTDSNISDVSDWLKQLFRSFSYGSEHDINSDSVNNRNGDIKGVRIKFNDYQWYRNRFLIIIGGNAEVTRRTKKPREYKMLNTIICFDLKRKHWTVYENALKQALLGMSSTICVRSEIHMKNDDDDDKQRRVKRKNLINNKIIVLHTFGGCCKSSGFDKNAVYHHWVLNLCRNISWDIERIIWVAYLKNESNLNQCKLALLPKAIIVHILLFLRNGLFFDSM